MSSFDEKLAARAASWKTENAPRGLATCPNCKNRRSSPIDGAEGSDFWQCTAPVILPTFTFSRESYRFAINLKLFDPAATYAARLNAMSCPLFTSADSMPSEAKASLI